MSNKAPPDDMSAAARYAGFSPTGYGSAAQQAMDVAAEYESQLRKHGQERVDRCIRLSRSTLMPFEHWLQVSDAELLKAEAPSAG